MASRTRDGHGGGVEGEAAYLIGTQVWDDTTTIDLAETGREGFLASYGYTAIERDGKLLISVGWFDWNETDSVLGETGLIVLDIESDTVERFDVDDRCGGITQPVVTESGDAYFASSAIAAAAHELGRLSTPRRARCASAPMKTLRCRLPAHARRRHRRRARRRAGAGQRQRSLRARDGR